jgi:hypothetical protein
MRIRYSAAAFVCALALFPASRARAGATVKSSKSNSSDREAAASTTGTQPVRTPTVKPIKSNSSDRAVSNGVKDPTPAEATTVKSSKSNSSERAVSNGTKDPTPAEAKFHGNGQNQTTLREAGEVTAVDAAKKTVTLKRKDGSVIVLDASQLARFPAVGQSVTVKYASVNGRPTAQSVAVTDEGAPPAKPKGKKG